MRRKKLEGKWILLALVLWILAMLLLFAVTFHNQKEMETENLELMNRQAVRQMNHVMEAVDHLNEYIKSDQQLEAMMKTEWPSTGRNWIEDFLNTRKNAAAHVEGVALLLDDGQSYVNVGAGIRPVSIRNSDWYQSYSGMTVTRYYSPLVDRYGNVNGEERNYVIAAYPYEVGQIPGDLLFLCPVTPFLDMLEEYKEKDIPVYVIGRDGEAIYTNREGNDGISQTCVEEILQSLRSSYHAVKDASLYTYISDCTRIGEWKVIAGLSFRHILFSMMFSYLFSAVLLSLIYIGFFMQIFYQQTIKKMDYAFLAAQINPHFVYKALNTIAYLCKKRRSDQAGQATRALEDILKDKLRVDEVMIYDTLQRELEVVRQYMLLQRIYYHSVMLEEKVDPELLTILIPKNILQPLVENALYHGLLPNVDEDGRIRGGVIQIGAQKEKKSILLSVSDNGVGMSREQIDQVFYGRTDHKNMRGAHIGIANIKNRLSYLHRLHYKMQVTSKPGEGTTVIIKIRNGRDVQDQG